MSGAVRVFGTPVKIDASLTIAASLTLTQGATNKNLTLSTTLPKTTSGVFDPFSFAARVASLLRADLRAKALAAGITVPLISGVLLRVVVPSFSASSAALFSLSFDPAGFLFGGVQMVLSSMALNNASGWASRLGLCAERDTTAALTIAGGVGVRAGVFQPRALWVFENSCSDTWEQETYPEESTIPLSDGTVRTSTRGVPEARRTIALIDQEDRAAGPPLDALVFASFDTDRSKINTASIDEGALSGASGLTAQGRALQGRPVRVGASLWASRAEAEPVSGVLSLFERAPASLSVAAGQRVQEISEAHAMLLEAKRLGYLFVFEPDDTTGQTRFLPSVYALEDNGAALRIFERRDLFLSLYRVSIPLIKRATPETE